MKLYAYICLVLALMVPARAAEPDERVKLAEEVVTVMRVEESFRTGWTTYPPLEGQPTMHVDPPEIAKARWAKVKTSFVQAYADVYTAEELRGLLDFYKSAVGQKVLDKAPQLQVKLLPLDWGGPAQAPAAK